MSNWRARVDKTLANSAAEMLSMSKKMDLILELLSSYVPKEGSRPVVGAGNVAQVANISTKSPSPSNDHAHIVLNREADVEQGTEKTCSASGVSDAALGYDNNHFNSGKSSLHLNSPFCSENLLWNVNLWAT